MHYIMQKNGKRTLHKNLTKSGDFKWTNVIGDSAAFRTMTDAYDFIDKYGLNAVVISPLTRKGK